MLILKRIILLTLLGTLGACSPKADAGSEKDEYPATDQSVMIIRDSEPEFKDRHLKFMHRFQEFCIESRVELMKLLGRVYDPKSERWSDDDILELHAIHTEEYFDGPNYMMVKIIRQMDNKTFGADISCKPRINTYKSVEIRKGVCDVSTIDYEKKKIFQMITPHEICKYDRGERPFIDQAGEEISIEGSSHKCKWSSKQVKTAAGLIPIPRVCSLFPYPKHSGTGRELVAMHYDSFDFPLITQPDFLELGEAYTDHLTSHIHKVTNLKMGVPLAGKISIPPDAKGFTRVDVNKTGSDE
jgi:hypothetical protein